MLELPSNPRTHDDVSHALQAVRADTAHQALGVGGCCPHPAGSREASRPISGRADRLVDHAGECRPGPSSSRPIGHDLVSPEGIFPFWPELVRDRGPVSTARRNPAEPIRPGYRPAWPVPVGGVHLGQRRPVRMGFDRPRGQTEAEGAGRPPGGAGQHGWTGAREGSWIAYTHRIPIPTLDVHAVDRYLWLAPMLGLDDRPPDFAIHLPPQATRTIEELLRSHGLGGKPLAVLVPGTIWETKHWPVAGFAQVGRHLLESGHEVVIAGTTRDRPRSQAIIAACPGAHDLSGQTTVAGLVALIRRAAICVTNDSGSMHVAVAVGSPVVSVFGPTNPIWIGPYGRPHAVVRVDVPCARATCGKYGAAPTTTSACKTSRPPWSSSG